MPMTVLICGSPGSGFEIIGLFANSADAQSYAEDYSLKDCRPNITGGICRKPSGDGFEGPSLTVFCRRRHQPMSGYFGRLVTRSSFVTTAMVLLAITASSRKNPNSATLSGSEIKKLNFGGKQKYAAATALANEARTPTVLP